MLPLLLPLNFFQRIYPAYYIIVNTILSLCNREFHLPHSFLTYLDLPPFHPTQTWFTSGDHGAGTTRRIQPRMYQTFIKTWAREDPAHG